MLRRFTAEDQMEEADRARVDLAAGRDPYAAGRTGIRDADGMEMIAMSGHYLADGSVGWSACNGGIIIALVREEDVPTWLARIDPPPARPVRRWFRR
jgi:hypothetical protein